MADDKLRQRHEEGDEQAQRAVMGARCRAGRCCAHQVPERELAGEEEAMLRRMVDRPSRMAAGAVGSSASRAGHFAISGATFITEEDLATASSLAAKLRQVFLQPQEDARSARACVAYRRGIDAGARLQSKEITPEGLVNEIRENPL